jgi:dihydropyrimidine dehydrogenase (NAD+) subunit PreT
MGELTRLLPSGRAEDTLPEKKPLYTEAEARAEAERCLYCTDAPCIQACPTSIDVPTFIKKIASGNVRGSARTILEQNLLGYSCSRVCPVEELCAGSCVYEGWGREPINIGRLQRFATETALGDHGLSALYAPKPKIGKRVACIGAGPASLAFAGALALEGVDAVLLEKRAVPGGLNTTGIAPYKLRAGDALREVEWVLDLGVELKAGVTVGPSGVRGAQLLADYDAVFVGVGLGEDSRLDVPGEDGPGVLGAVDWIERMKLDPAATRPRERVLVIGGGNTALDVAHECALLGARDVVMVYRRGKEQMSGYAHELEGARVDGVRLLDNAVPVAFVRDHEGNLVAARLARTEGGKPVLGSEWEVPCDLVVLAIGQSKLGSIVDELPGVARDAKGLVVVDPTTCQTGNPKVFAGGDCINGGKEVVNAVADGRNAARFLLAAWKGANNG